MSDEPTPQEEWEEHNEPFNYEPPNKDPELWSSEEYQELHDRTIRRRVTWECQRCCQPFGSLEKARRHVQRKHGESLLDQAKSLMDLPEDDETFERASDR